LTAVTDRAEVMSQKQNHSLRYEYELYVDQEIENYKDSVPRAMILRIGDEAVAFLREREQPEFDELVIWAEVDQIIRRRLRLPSYATWRRKRLKLLAQYRRPEHWGLAADAPLVREIVPDTETRVLIAGMSQEGPVLYLAAKGCRVTALEEDEAAVERVITAAGQVGLTSRVDGCAVGLDSWAPDAPLNAVVFTPAAFARLTPDQRIQVIELLKGATKDGGVHLVETLVAGQREAQLGVPSDDELRARYRGWDVSIVRDERANRTFLARKNVA
jgi:hypothetical protein